MKLHHLFLALFLLLPLSVLAAGEPQQLVHDDAEVTDETAPATPPQMPPQMPGARHEVSHAPAPPSLAPHKEDGVEKSELAAPVLTSYGTLDEKSGALAMDIWKGTSYSDASKALQDGAQRIVSGNDNSVLNDVLRRAALSRVYEPEGAAEGANPFFNARVFAAQATGDSDGALSLLQKRSEAFKAQDWQRFIEAEMLTNHMDKACELLTHLANDSAFTQQMAILCEMKQNQPDAARLHLDVLREAGGSDALFLELAEKALSPKAKITQKLDNLSPLHLAVLALGKVKIANELADSFAKAPQPLYLNMSMPDASRVRVMESLARSRRLTRKDVESFMAGVPIPAKIIGQIRAAPDALSTFSEKELPAALRRITVMKAIMDEDAQVQKAHILSALLSNFSNADVLGALGDSLMTDVEGIAPLPDNAFAAPAILRLLLLRGGKETQSWWRMAAASPANREGLLPLFPLALYRGLISDDESTSWFEAFGRTQAISAERKNMAFALLKILGVMLPSNVDSQISAQNTIPVSDAQDTRIPTLLELIAADGNETALRAVQALKIIRQDKTAETLVLLRM